MGTTRQLDVRRLGLVPYGDALGLQRSLVDDRRAARVHDLLLLLEHPHVLTLGMRAGGGRALLGPHSPQVSSQ